MARSDQNPRMTIVDGPGNLKRERYDHPAYGVIRYSVSQGGDRSLFGSDIQHRQTLHFEICRAHLDRDLSSDWIHGSETIVEFEMSYAHFAQLITTVGKGEGTPVTLTYAPEDGTRVHPVPGIRNIETKVETLRRELIESADEKLSEVQGAIDDLEAVIKSGKFTKGALSEVLKRFKRGVEHLPSNMAFVVEQADEAMEQIVSDAKIEIDSYIRNATMAAGVKQLTGKSSNLLLESEGEDV